MLVFQLHISVNKRGKKRQKMYRKMNKRTHLHFMVVNMVCESRGWAFCIVFGSTLCVNDNDLLWLCSSQLLYWIRYTPLHCPWTHTKNHILTLGKYPTLQAACIKKCARWHKTAITNTIWQYQLYLKHLSCRSTIETDYHSMKQTVIFILTSVQNNMTFTFCHQLFSHY